MNRARWGITVMLVLACTASPGEGQGRQTTLAEFKQLQWIAGTWRGSGGNYPSFFEEYRVVDDSTIAMRSFKDSTLSAVGDSSRIELRGGLVYNRGEGPGSVATELTSTRVRFVPQGRAGGGFSFERLSPDEWKATLHPAAAGGKETIYQMRRIRN